MCSTCIIFTAVLFLQQKTKYFCLIHFFPNFVNRGDNSDISGGNSDKITFII